MFLMGEFEELKKQILDYNPKAEIELIEKAYYFAKEAHKGQPGYPRIRYKL